jgi:hypothetical protein
MARGPGCRDGRCFLSSLGNSVLAFMRIGMPWAQGHGDELRAPHRGQGPPESQNPGQPGLCNQHTLGS